MFHAIKNMLPDGIRYRIRFVRHFWQYLRDFYYDFRQYTHHAAVLHPARSRQNLQAHIIIHYHALEKGLSLKEPRFDFGVQKANTLLELLKTYVLKYGYDTIAVIAINVLVAHYEFKAARETADEVIWKEISTLRNQIPDALKTEKRGGIIEVNRQDILDAGSVDFERFTSSRHSVRHYSEEPVDHTLIEKAVSMAMKTPSVCNRQPAKVYIISDPKIRKSFLDNQRGNKGFGDDIGTLLLVTAELGFYAYSVERREPYIGGGMFAMSLVYALHSLGLGTCCLNLSQHSHFDKLLKQSANISDSEVVIMLIAVGHLPDKFKVASSPRRDINEVLGIRQ